MKLPNPFCTVWGHRFEHGPGASMHCIHCGKVIK